MLEPQSTGSRRRFLSSSRWLRAEPEVPAAAPPATNSRVRLVIRAEILPEEEPRTEIRQHSSRRALPLILGAVAVLALSWIGYRVFRADPPSASAAAKVAVRDATPQSPPPVSAPEAASVEPAATAPKSVRPELPDASQASPSPQRRDPAGSPKRSANHPRNSGECRFG